MGVSANRERSRFAGNISAFVIPGRNRSAAEVQTLPYRSWNAPAEQNSDTVSVNRHRPSVPRHRLPAL